MPTQFGTWMALSPDGSRLVYAGSSDDEPWQLWNRPADELEATPLPGTAGSWSPVFSPDGSSLAVVDPSSKLQVLDLQRGSVRTPADSVVLIVDWTPDGHLFYYRTGTRSDVRRVDERGGESRLMGASEGSPLPPGFLWGGSILPGGERLVADWAPVDGTNTSAVAAVDFTTGEVKELIQGSDPRYVERGYLLWGTPEGTLMAAPFDPESLAFTGPAVAVVRGVIRDKVRHHAVHALGVRLHGVPGGRRERTGRRVGVGGPAGGHGTGVGAERGPERGALGRRPRPTTTGFSCSLWKTPPATWSGSTTGSTSWSG